jgi:hypothetical protein
MQRPPTAGVRRGGCCLEGTAYHPARFLAPGYRPGVARHPPQAAPDGDARQDQDRQAPSRAAGHRIKWPVQLPCRLLDRAFARTFSLTKWYLDCVDAGGRAAIAYWASLAWRGLALTWHSVLLHEPAGTSRAPHADTLPQGAGRQREDPFSRQRSSLVRVAAPRRDGCSIVWAARALGCSIAVAPRQPPIAVRLLDGGRGAVDWHCEAPAARSAAGLWVVSPVLALAAVAFLAGFERDATRRRYGAAVGPLLRLPAAAASPSAAAYFGAVAGVVAAGVAAQAAGLDGWLLVAALGIGGAFAQAIGRLRCLVQGCCHGREAPAGLGIRYTHPRSRVVRLSRLGGVPLHPTPVYSMAWTLLAGCLLLRLWLLGCPLQLIAGAYFILIGLGRFVEEHFRGEPQTAPVAGLRLYQWLAIAFVVGGAAVTACGADPAPPPPPFDPGALPLAAGLGIVTYAAYGVDFPRSRRRFSRLA